MLIDIHTHTARRRPPAVARPNGCCYPTPESLIRMLDANGIDRAVVFSMVSPECRYTLVPPEETLAICAEWPERLIPFCNLDPRFLTNSPRADFRPLLNAYRALGCKGLGEYIPNLPFDDPLNLNLFMQCEELGFPVLFHLAPALGGYYGLYDAPGLPRLENVLRACPRLVFLAHSQVFWAEIAPLADASPEARHGYPKGPVREGGRVVELMRRYPNLHGDLSAGSGLNALTRDAGFGLAFLEEFQDRLYFGTDIASDPQEPACVPYFRKLKDERLISDEAFEKITWRNAARLLGLAIEAPANRMAKPPRTGAAPAGPRGRM